MQVNWYYDSQMNWKKKNVKKCSKPPTSLVPLGLQSGYYVYQQLYHCCNLVAEWYYGAAQPHWSQFFGMYEAIGQRRYDITDNDKITN